VNYTGRVIAYSSGDGPIDAVQFEKRSVTNFLKVTVNLKFHSKDTPKERIELKGFENCQVGPGSMLSHEENGTYYKLPPSENIDDQPHYFKNDAHPRHLYFASRGRHVADGGYRAISHGALEGYGHDARNIDQTGIRAQVV
jgi:hypothetical protein